MKSGSFIAVLIAAFIMSFGAPSYAKEKNNNNNAKKLITFSVENIKSKKYLSGFIMSQFSKKKYKSK